MARGRGKVEVSLFPFLSVLCCMIGVFMLFLVIILSTRVIEAEDQARQAVKEPQRKAAEGNGNDDAQAIDAHTYWTLDQQLTELTGQLAQRQSERYELSRRLEELQVLFETKRDELSLARLTRNGKQPLALDEPDPVRPVPDARFRVMKTPVYIEIKLEGYLVQPGKTLYPPLTKKRVGKEDQYTASSEFREFLEQVDQDRQNKYLLFLVHPNGIDEYGLLRKYLTKEFQEKTEIPEGNRMLVITKSRIDMGVEPFSMDWQFFAEQSKP